jgi:transcriptional regulator with AAA-type ATPase domain/transcriptional regulatory protein LevR
MSRKDRVYQLLKKKTENFLANKNDIETDASRIGEELGIARYNASRDLNDLVQEKKVIKVSGRPVNYFASEVLNISTDVSEFDDLPSLLKVMDNQQEITDYPFTELIGYSGSLASCVKQAKAALIYPPHGLNTLITGKSGTGKTTFATFMYQYAVKNGILKETAPYIIFNCADYSNNPHLLLDHLFGHSKSAFTGADADKSGLVESANNGILFLDEIHRLPAEGQEMLFSILDRGEFYRLGESDKPRKVSVLIIGATTEDVQSSMLTTFLRRIPLIINMPDLKERGLSEKIELIHFCFKQEAVKIRKKLKVNEDVVRFFLQYEPAGNIGQLKNDIRLLCANALVDNLGKNISLIQIKLSHLSPYFIDQFYYSKSNNCFSSEMKEKLKLYQIEGMEFSPEENENNPFYLVENSDINQNILPPYANIFSKENEENNSFLKNGKESGNHQPIFKIVSRKRFELIIQILNQITKQENYRMEDSNIKNLALHLDTLIDKIEEGYSFQEGEIKKEFKNSAEINLEKIVAKKICREIFNRLNIILPENEIFYISLYLKAMSTQYSDKTIGVLVLMHGESAASDLANTANKLLNVNHAVGLNMPLTASVKEFLQLVTRKVKELDQGNGVIILSDMGSLNMFGDIIHQKTGVNLRTIKMVTTPMVIEATRKAILPQMTLETLYSDINRESILIGSHVEKPSEKETEDSELSFEEMNKNKIIYILDDALTFLNSEDIYEILKKVDVEIENRYAIKEHNNFWIKFLFHTSCMVERAISKEQFERNDVFIIIKKSREMYHTIRKIIEPVENRFGITINDSEVSYIMDIIEVSKEN